MPEGIPTDPRLKRLYESAKRLAVLRERKERLAKAAAGPRVIGDAMAAERAKNPPATPPP
jgi:hypothetical protein